MSSNTPLITVLMSVFNGRKYLPAAVESILNQTYKDFEFLIIDDGSTDGTAELLKSYAGRDSRIRIFHQANMGLTRSLNFGLNAARGKWIARQDADDVSQADRLETLIGAAKDEALISSLFLNIKEESHSLPLQTVLMGSLPLLAIQKLLRFENFLAHGSFFLNREKIIALGGYRTEFKLSQDYDLILRVLEKDTMKLVRRYLYRTRIHDESLGRTAPAAQYQYAALASLFAEERRIHGKDSYELLSRVAPGDLLRELSQEYPQFFSRLGWMARLRKRKGLEFKGHAH